MLLSECRNAYNQCTICLSVVLLNAVTQSAVMRIGVMLSVTMLNLITLSAVMQIFVTLNAEFG
jgi:hypothetical protein